jgi:phage/plasmid primase-like uncharacterized protein
MTKEYRYTVERVKPLARGRWLSILPALCGNGELFAKASKRVGRSYDATPCPICGGTDRYGFLPSFVETGASKCRHCGSFPDGFTLLREINGWSLAWALQQVEEYVNGGACAEPAARDSAGVAENIGASDDKSGAIKYLLDTSSRTPHKAARLYYQNRGIPAAADVRIDTLRYHAAADVYFQKKPLILNGAKVRYPCIIGRSSAKGRWLGLHQIFITKDGFSASNEIRAIIDTIHPESAPNKFSKKNMIGGMTGGAVRFGNAGKTLAVGEGIETMLSVSIGLGGFMSVAAAGTAALLNSMEIPDRVERLLIFADKDVNNAGLNAAEALREKQRHLREVEILMPDMAIPDGKKGIDWLDSLNKDASVLSTLINGLL